MFLLYRELEHLLEKQEWYMADKLTAMLMCQIMNRNKEGWLNYWHISDFPCHDLRRINRLWVHYSNKKFGFSIQNVLWLECGGYIGNNDYETCKKFATKVGWYDLQNNEWITYTTFMNNTQNGQQASTGSLPCLVRCCRIGGVFSSLGDRTSRCVTVASSLMRKLMSCNI